MKIIFGHFSKHVHVLLANAFRLPKSDFLRIESASFTHENSTLKLNIIEPLKCYPQSLQSCFLPVLYILCNQRRRSRCRPVFIFEKVNDEAKKAESLLRGILRFVCCPLALSCASSGAESSVQTSVLSLRPLFLRYLVFVLFPPKHGHPFSCF